MNLVSFNLFGVIVLAAVIVLIAATFIFDKLTSPGSWRAERGRRRHLRRMLGDEYMVRTYGENWESREGCR